MKLSVLSMVAMAVLAIAGCSSTDSGEAAATADSFKYKFVGLEEDSTTKRKKAVFELTNGSKMNVAYIAGTYQILDKEGELIEKNTFSKDDYPHLLGPGETKKMTVLRGTLPSNAVTVKIKVTNVRFK